MYFNITGIYTNNKTTQELMSIAIQQSLLCQLKRFPEILLHEKCGHMVLEHFAGLLQL